MLVQDLFQLCGSEREAKPNTRLQRATERNWNRSQLHKHIRKLSAFNAKYYVLNLLETWWNVSFNRRIEEKHSHISTNDIPTYEFLDATPVKLTLWVYTPNLKVLMFNAIILCPLIDCIILWRIDPFCKQLPLLGNARNNRTMGLCNPFLNKRFGKLVSAATDTNTKLEERYFLCVPCRGVISRTVWSSELVVRWNCQKLSWEFRCGVLTSGRRRDHGSWRISIVLNLLPGNG
jgi:hypothetical protein